MDRNPRVNYIRFREFEGGFRRILTVPGGLCAAWKRKGYTFDISMHMLVGSKSGPFKQMWQELGVLAGREFHCHDETVRIESGGKGLDIRRDPRRLEDQMLALSPADADLTKELIRLLSGKSIMRGASLKPAEMFGLADNIKIAAVLLPLIGVFIGRVAHFGPKSTEAYGNLPISADWIGTPDSPKKTQATEYGGLCLNTGVFGAATTQ